MSASSASIRSPRQRPTPLSPLSLARPGPASRSARAGGGRAFLPPAINHRRRHGRACKLAARASPPRRGPRLRRPLRRRAAAPVAAAACAEAAKGQTRRARPCRGVGGGEGAGAALCAGRGQMRGARRAGQAADDGQGGAGRGGGRSPPLPETFGPASPWAPLSARSGAAAFTPRPAVRAWAFAASPHVAGRPVLPRPSSLPDRHRALPPPGRSAHPQAAWSSAARAGCRVR